MRTNILTKAGRLEGDVVLPGDKSISHRAVMLGSIAQGTTRISGLLECDDCNYTIKAFQDMGVRIIKKSDSTIIEGLGLRSLKRPDAPLYMGNSGTTMRVLSGILAGQDFDVVLEADALLSKRPMDRIVKPLALMGVDIRSGPGGSPPIKITGGRIKPITYSLPVPSAQVKSAILLAGLYASGVTVVEETYKSRDHTERMLKYFGSDVRIDGLKVSVNGLQELSAQDINVPKDISSASFFMVAATILAGSKLKIEGVSTNPTRAGIIEIMRRMGARLDLVNPRNDFEPAGDMIVESSETRGTIIERDAIPSIIDELPVIFVLAALSKGRTVIKGVGELKVKETDRIKSMISNLGSMGARLSMDGDDMIIEGVAGLKPAQLKSFGDHRTCMAMAVASLRADGDSRIDDIECVSKSFPDFFEILNRLKR